MATPMSPGWYPAPDGNGHQWWNGAGWSESRRNADGSTPGLPGYSAAPPAVPVPAAPLQNATPVQPGMPTPLGAPNPYAQSGVPMPARSGVRTSGNSGLVGLILGVVSLVAFSPLGIAAIILGIVGLRRPDMTPASRGMSIGAIVLGAIGLLVGLIGLIAGIAFTFVD